MRNNSSQIVIRSASVAPFIRLSAFKRGAARLALAGGLAWAACGALPVQAAPADTMIKAVKFDDVKEVTKQLANGMDPNMTDDQGMPLLVLAAREKSDKVAAALIANPKTNIEIEDKAGENAMMLASLNGDINLVNLLISKDAEVNKKGWAPLHYAASNGNDDIVKLLLDHSAYVDAGSPNGTTPLMMAARANHVSTVKLLLDNGADLTVKNQLGLTALDFAKHYKAPDVVEGLTARLQQMQSQPPAAPQNGAK
ncbi:MULTISPECIES: ankyrin repeat domain-containing protein [Paraburkholderia]|uniref:ankyrin repeat domain-containing protein n=1 Tax=Paraburkholderia TaxID=1822464 RepID=UPI00224CEDA4|nr:MULTISPECIES: ankyrin repeat domain-containing protein [Paraburkholderia]MCX4165269.1 ankyrin repeat domain-containing protein [Paraburkholderia megapolitana]MDN7160761.1 ankyrin repeat domain-containing protein [Paraburkholderia sp. CHISQ3]MDQ6497808.1 ankyrin repeat domain-containing protein [Paraburkholderia megapolitana]